MKKALAIFAILLMVFSFAVIAQEEGAPPSEPTPPPSEPTPPPSEPAPAEAPSEPALPPAEEPPEPELTPEGSEAPAGEPMPPIDGPLAPPGEQRIEQPPQEPGICYWDGKQIPCEQMPSNREPSKQYPSQPGPGSGGCWVGEQQVPCPDEGPKLDEGCREVIEPNGMRRVECLGNQRAPAQMGCTPGDVRERIEKDCAAKGGKVVTRNIDPSQGCGIVDCVFGAVSGGNFMPGQQAGCPSPDEMAKKEEACRQMGLNAKRMRSNCEYVQCEDPNKKRMECPDNHDEWERVSQACTGKVVKAFDANGCNIPQCVGEGQECSNNVPQEAYFKCEDQGGKLVVNTDENGCIAFSKCVKRGEEGIEAEEIDEVPPAARLLQVALKLESIKISFDQMAKQISAIADYYENEDDDANAERFRTAAGMFESAKKQIDGVKEELKMAARGMSKEQLIDIKHKIRQISDVVMEDALYVILGGEDIGGYESAEGTEEEMPDFMPAATNDCGSDGNCFGKALRICMAGASVSPDRNVNIRITGLENGACIIEGRANTPEGEKELACKFADYATDLLNEENFMQFCEGSFVDYVKNSLGGKLPESTQNRQQFSSEQAFEGQMMGCEKVERGINKKGECGNECCEQRFGESYYSCPNDCIGGAQQAGKQPFVEKAQQVFRQDGAGGCADEISGQSPKDVCGNECCEPGESRGNCPEDCTGEPMNDEGRFFNEQRGPMVAPQEQFGQPQDYIGPGEQMPSQEPVNIREGPIGPAPVQEPTETMPVQEQPIEEPGGGGAEQASEPAAEGGGEGIVAGAAVAIDLLKEFLGR